MKPRHQATRAAIDLIKRFEGFRAKAAQLPDGGYTIGYGHTRTARAGAVVTESDADALLIYDVAAVVAAISEWVYSPLTQNQFDSLVAFVFSIGLPNFRRSSVLRRLNEGSHLQAACAMEMWRTADFEGERIVVDALVRRRSAEMALFLQPQDGYVPVPSLIVLPRVDSDQARTAPMAATEIETPLDGAVAAMRLMAEEGPLETISASRAAFAAVTARLQDLLNETETVVLATEPAPAAQPATAAVEAAPETAAEVQPEPVFAEAQPIELHPALAIRGQPIMFEAKPTGSLTMRRRHKRTPEPVLALMGVAGLGIAGGGVFWGVNANAAERLLPLALPDHQMTGFGVSLAGVAMLVASIYLLLTRMAMRDY